MEDSTGDFRSASAALGQDVMVGLAPMYAGYARHNTFVGGASIWLMKGHTEAEVNAAKAFLAFIRSPEQQVEFSKKTGYLPVTSQAIQRMENDPASPAVVKPGIASMSSTPSANDRGIRLGFFVQFRDIFREDMQKAFAGQQSVEASLDDAKQRGDALLRRFAGARC